jgi:hypothetical protein
MATIALIVAFCLPWWSLRAWVLPRAPRTYLTVSTGFAGWGWLSFLAALVALALTTRLILARRTWLDKRIVAWVTMTAGAAELLGNWLFIITAPKTWLGGGAGQVATRGVGLTVATVAGVVLIISGVLMGAPHRRRSPAESAMAAARVGTVFLAMATLALFVAFFLPWSSIRASVPGLPSHLVSNGFSSWGWLSFIAWLVMVAVVVWRVVVPESTRGDTPRKRMVSQLVAWATVAAGVAELIGNALFMATKTTFSVPFGHPPSIGAGFVIAVVAGWVVIASGLLVVVSSAWRSPVSSPPSVQSTFVG